MAERTGDAGYNTVGRDDFPALMDVERYGKRSTHFEEIIATDRGALLEP